jgi:hypothetical protein
VNDERATALRVAKWLVEKDRPDEAVGLLAAWAAAGPNDAEGQGLLAEALRVDPAARIAQMAFERMEGVPGEHGELDAHIKHYSADELKKLEAEMKRPSFRRAQMGFNNNIKFQERVFHVQTEDSGLDQPHVVTHLFADGGRIVKSHKRSYANEVRRSDVAEHVRALMKSQHLEMVLMLREGRFDAVIGGREIGGMEVLTNPPNVDNIKKLAGKKQRAADARTTAKEAPDAKAARREERAPAPEVSAARTVYTLHVLRSLSGGPERYDLPESPSVIGAAGAIGLPGERFCHAREASLSVRDGRLLLEDHEGGNGVFLRIRTPVELEIGDEFVVGDQLLRIDSFCASSEIQYPTTGPIPIPPTFIRRPSGRRRSASRRCSKAERSAAASSRAPTRSRSDRPSVTSSFPTIRWSESSTV